MSNPEASPGSQPYDNPETAFIDEVRNGYGEIPDTLRDSNEQEPENDDPGCFTESPEGLPHFDQNLGEAKQLEGAEGWVENIGWCKIVYVDSESGGARVVRLEGRHDYTDLSINDLRSRLHI